MKTPRYIVTAEIPKEQRDIIDERAKALDRGRGPFVAAIIDLWVQAGSPPIDAADKLLVQSRKKAARRGTSS